MDEIKMEPESESLAVKRRTYIEKDQDPLSQNGELSNWQITEIKTEWTDSICDLSSEMMLEDSYAFVKCEVQEEPHDVINVKKEPDLEEIPRENEVFSERVSFSYSRVPGTEASNNCTVIWEKDMAISPSVKDVITLSVSTRKPIVKNKVFRNLCENDWKRVQQTSLIKDNICRKSCRQVKYMSKRKKVLNCEVCGKCYAQSASLSRHVRSHSGVKPFKCHICGKSFSYSGGLTPHLRIHTGEKPFKCEECGKCFTISGNLKHHIRIHTGEKPFKCKVCYRCFSSSSDLKSHSRLHTGERPYKCEECGRSFSRSGDLKCHIRIHTGERPLKCDTCGKSFSLKGSLKRHVRSHTGEKPFKCDLCGRCFSLMGNLKCHSLIHSGKKPLECHTCGKHFALSGNLKRHLRMHSGK